MEEPPQEKCRELGELDELRARAQALAVKREQGSCFRRRVSVSWFQQTLGLPVSFPSENETFVDSKANVSESRRQVLQTL